MRTPQSSAAFVRPSQAARELSITRRVLMSLVASGRFTAIRLPNGRALLLRREVDQFRAA